MHTKLSHIHNNSLSNSAKKSLALYLIDRNIVRLLIVSSSTHLVPLTRQLKSQLFNMATVFASMPAAVIS